MVSAALLDGQVMPDQYEPDRIARDDIQTLLNKVKVTPKQEYSDRFPDEMVTNITIHMNDGTEYNIEKTDYEGFTSRPMSWETVTAKFNLLAGPHMGREERENLIKTVFSFEDHDVSDLMKQLEVLEKVGK
jgi:2-methylcitrate dehydratase